MSWDLDAQHVAEARLDALYEHEEACQGLDPSAWPPYPGAAPFCGCQRCVVREALDAAWPVLRRAALEGAPE